MESLLPPGKIIRSPFYYRNAIEGMVAGIVKVEGDIATELDKLNLYYPNQFYIDALIFVLNRNDLRYIFWRYWDKTLEVMEITELK